MKIKEEFRDLIPKLTQEEFDSLRASCLRDGIRDAIVTWKDIIIDGHNRFEIAKKNGLSYETIEMQFDSEEQVKEWMINNQFARRNINAYQRSLLALELENLFKDKAKGNLKFSGGRGVKGLPTLANLIEPIHTRKEISKKANVSHGTIDKVKLIKKQATPEQKEQLITGEVSINNIFTEIKKEEKKEIKEEKRQIYENRIKEVSTNDFSINIFDTDKKFRVIYADPAWSYNDKQDTDKLGGAKKHYDTMSISQLCELPIKDLSERDSVLFLWVTSPLLEDAFKVINAWGFKYKTSFIWDKVKHNMGHYNSVRHEILLVCTKGSCTPDNIKLYDSVQSIEKNSNHSEKPIEFINIIDDIYTFGNRIELFAREIKKQNWYGWGNEL